MVCFCNLWDCGRWRMWFLCRAERETEEYLRGAPHLPLFLHIFRFPFDFCCISIKFLCSRWERESETEEYLRERGGRHLLLFLQSKYKTVFISVFLLWFDLYLYLILNMSFYMCTFERGRHCQLLPFVSLHLNVYL